MASRGVSFSRFLSTSRVLRDTLAQPLKAQSHGVHDHEATAQMWKNIFFFVCCPSILVSYMYCKSLEPEPRPEFKKYSYLRIRNKKYPWGDGNKTLFHNPHVNALPDGYEDEH